MTEQYQKPKWYRCTTCNKLGTMDSLSTEFHAGHRVKVAFHVSFWEWLGVKLGLIR
jgi:hypothetical protein